MEGEIGFEEFVLHVFGEAVGVAYAVGVGEEVGDSFLVEGWMEDDSFIVG